MQTKQQIRQLLASAGIYPNKHLGQNFLIDQNLMQRLTDSANIGKDDVVLEVGCGTGSLTEAIAERAGIVITVEIDEMLAKIVSQGQLAEQKNVKVINTDILESKHAISVTVTDAIKLAKEKYPGQVLLVANLPYNVASPVMMNLVTGPIVADGMYVTIQKEVAQRMVALPGNKCYGTLSVLLGATGDAKIERILKPTVFWPEPGVTSAMVSFVRSSEKADRIRDMKLFSNVVNLFMGYRRKMLKTCSKLASGKLAEISNWSEIFGQCSIDPNMRPDAIGPEDYIAIANACEQGLR